MAFCTVMRHLLRKLFYIFIEGAGVVTLKNPWIFRTIMNLHCLHMIYEDLQEFASIYVWIYINVRNSKWVNKACPLLLID